MKGPAKSRCHKSEGFAYTFCITRAFAITFISDTIRFPFGMVCARHGQPTSTSRNWQDGSDEFSGSSLLAKEMMRKSATYKENRNEK